MADVLERPKTSRKALVSLALGLASPVGFILTGLPALLIGLSGLREINRSEGRLRGRVAAATGMLLGLVASSLFVLWLVVQLFANVRLKAEREACADRLMY